MARPPDIPGLLAALDAKPAPPSSDYDLNADPKRPVRDLRAAAVLVAIWGDDLILTKRASTLKHHPGQIALPGGKVDAGESVTDAALREASEEIGLHKDAVQALAPLPAHETVTGYAITPILAQVTRDFTPVADASEVAEIFRVPLACVLDPARYRVEGRRWRGMRRHYYVVPHGPYYIWGATARILKALADRVGP